MHRRNFLRRLGGSVAVAATPALLKAETPSDKGFNEGNRTREYLKKILFSRREVEEWIAGRQSKTSGQLERYDADIGWVHIDGRRRDGIDGAISTYRCDQSGARRMIAYCDKPCRINTYGDSFTHCDQVSDGESWQEYLAAHLCEPIRNYGVSGHGVYQMYVRMQREELRTPAKTIIVNIYSDDHYRSLRCWDAITGRSDRPTKPHVAVNPATGMFVEHTNPCPEPDSLFNLCDLDWVYATFKNNLALRIRTAGPDEIMELARQQGIDAKSGASEEPVDVRAMLRTSAAFFASRRIVEKMEAFAATHKKKILYVLSYAPRDLADILNGKRRFDQEFIDFMKMKQLPYVDLAKAHAEDFAKFKIGVNDYLDRYYIGHYNPSGNFFCAMAMKQKLVDFLEPKPVTYEQS